PRVLRERRLRRRARLLSGQVRSHEEPDAAVRGRCPHDRNLAPPGLLVPVRNGLDSPARGDGRGALDVGTRRKADAHRSGVDSPGRLRRGTGDAGRHADLRGGAMIPTQWFLILSALLFAIGVCGVLTRKNGITIFMSI